MMPRFAFALLLFTVAGCVTAAPDPDGSVTRQVRLNETARLSGLEVTPISVTEDSRCPRGVQCIQAGTVRLAARVSDRAGGRTLALTLGVPVRLQGGWTSLVQACPYPVHSSPIRPGDYRFTLMLTTAESPPLIDAGGCAPL